MRVVRDVRRGIHLYWQGVLLWRTRPRLAALGLVPGLITAWLFTLAFVALLVSLGSISEAIADAIVGDSQWHGLVSIVAAGAVLAAALVVAVVTFVSVTGLIGQGIFESISRRVDESLGPVPEGPAERWWRAAPRALGEGVAMVALSVPLAVGVALIGLVPVLGAVAAWIVSATVGGWLLALEFTASPFERRGMSLAQRRQLLRQHRAVAVGFGASAFIASSVAPLAVVTMPLSVAGGAHLARYVIDGANER